MTQDVRKTLVVLSQIKAAVEVGMGPIKAIALAMESPSVSGLFSDEVVKRVIDSAASGNYPSVALSKLDILSEYDQAMIQAGEDCGDLVRTFDAIIDQHMFIRSLGI